MRTKEVNFKRYYPSEGKALKITQRVYNYCTQKEENRVLYTYAEGALVDENSLVVPVEEVPLEEYEKWYNANCCYLGMSGLR